ncbi:MAG TPA: methyltransferase domain-containing protein [Chloroflexota bacterium]
MNTSTKARYIAWAARGWLGADRSCPACGSPRTRLLKRKHLVTALFRCDTCGLMFRMPKGSQLEDQSFYQREYQQGGTTDLPDPSELVELQRLSFAPIGRDYSGYIEVLRALGVPPGATVYDYGASWGYGSWQFAQAGYRVYSYELSQPRARFAEQYLGCQVVADPRAIPERVDCFFASHVLEHLAQPGALWQLAAETVRPDGVVVLFMPNGEPGCEVRDPERYHQLWGRVHPLLLTSASVAAMAAPHCFDTLAYSSPFDLERVAARCPGLLDGDELLVVARPRT